MDHPASQRVASGIERVTAPNASPWTAQGTNAYLVDADAGVLLVDPGPDDDHQLVGLLSATRGRRVAAILCTHTHLDHSALAPRLSEATGAPVWAFGDSLAGWRHYRGDVGGGGGLDRRFRPDRLLADGERLEPWGLTVIHTPGHMGNHVCLDRGEVLLTGDQAMGWATSIVSPPEGDMADYIASTGRLLALGSRTLLPGHGAPVPDGAARLARLLTHRRDREAEVLAALAEAPSTAAALTGRIYADLPEAMQRAAGRNVLSHLIDLDRRGLVQGRKPLAGDTVFALA